MPDMNVEFHNPKDGRPFCPYLPPIPIPKAIQGSGVDLYLTPCGGPTCATFSSCKGQDSPAARRQQVFPMISHLLRAMASMPLLGAELKATLSATASACADLTHTA